MELHDLARHNVVSTRDATTLGLGPSDLRRMVRQGEIRRLIRGWYAVGSPDADRPPWEGEDEWETARAEHRLLTIALLRSFEGRVVASHQSALVLHGVRLWKSDLETAHVCRTDDDHTRRRAAAVLHPACGVDPVKTADGFLTVPVATAVVQAGLHAPRDGLPPFPFESLVAADGALHDGLVTKEELEAAVRAHSRLPGIHGVRTLLAHADGRHESVGETRLAHTMRALGYQFTPQVKVTAGGRRWRVDFVLDDDPVIVEFDGLAKYSGGLMNPAPEQLRKALALEKWREDRLRSTEREVVRFVWAEADDAPVVRTRLDAAIARARGRLGA
ncbi:type IV toxin-antitoxin system AbiEi family antitoxin domain-containing protein [Knoellia sp. 3-2P3]|uniref:type IV toxin-antitoxin system AbiEi family antitoxin domain-containing protein n=1 Tax=unclassified Knoellia TaxID=2618719 RepID=UPI0023D9BA1A|nr:type IV toxin-antitoxin system AbiEi family antitoxin domain-containing protein [Knoellia sp. 3-2P3]MDF2093547.1 type IV toxin-antitoxin system AbiEi family antitoxin domain-containing protein [Knoellia sp. 3-2P3]